MSVFENQFENIIWNYFKNNTLFSIIAGVIIIATLGNNMEKVADFFRLSLFKANKEDFKDYIEKNKNKKSLMSRFHGLCYNCKGNSLHVNADLVDKNIDNSKLKSSNALVLKCNDCNSYNKPIPIHYSLIPLMLYMISFSIPDLIDSNYRLTIFIGSLTTSLILFIYIMLTVR